MIKNDQILSLLKKHIDINIDTVAVQDTDLLDKREVHIGSLVTLVKKAFEAGCTETRAEIVLRSGPGIGSVAINSCPPQV